jgi:hypothetical protein
MKVLIQDSAMRFLCVDSAWTKEISKAWVFKNTLEAMLKAIYVRSTKPAMILRVLLSFGDPKYDISLPLPESPNVGAQLSRLRKKTPYIEKRAKEFGP